MSRLVDGFWCLFDLARGYMNRPTQLEELEKEAKEAEGHAERARAGLERTKKELAEQRMRLGMFLRCMGPGSILFKPLDIWNWN